MAAYFSKFTTAYINGGATPNMTDARKTLDFQGFPGIVYISGGAIRMTGLCRSASQRPSAASAARR